MKRFGQFVKAKVKLVFTFGRFNPPTIGHQKLLQAVLRTAKSEGGKPFIFGVILRTRKRILVIQRKDDISDSDVSKRNERSEISNGLEDRN